MEHNVKYNSLIIDGKLIEITGENVSIKISEATEKEIEEHKTKRIDFSNSFDYWKYEESMN